MASIESLLRDGRQKSLNTPKKWTHGEPPNLVQANQER